MSAISTLPLKSIIPFIILILFLTYSISNAQVVINEGSNKNYSSIPDEDGQYPDWIELHNAGTDTVSLSGYSLTDDIADTSRWVFSNVSIGPGEYKVVFCSGKDRKPVTSFKQVLYTGPFNPVTGWNKHELTTPFTGMESPIYY
ncbi:MAG: lamin tail domain-containing protein [Saprospiraceae bacterium]|nr:lamin tail domain-containing protein [Candidatus Opimibacter iunctus]